MTWRERQKSELRDRLLAASLELFRTQGFEQTTVQQIADEVGVGKGTFFNHFSTKVMVLIEWYRQLTMDALAEAEAQPHATAREAMQALAKALAARANADPELWSMKSRHAFVDANLQSEEHDLDGVLDDYCLRHLSAGKARGEIAPDLEERFIAGMFNAVLTGTGHSWVLAGHGFDLQKTIASRVDFLFRAAAPRGESSRKKTS